jgi:hypothetical protein
MQREDFDAPTTSHDASDSEMSCMSDADSCPTKRRKLDSICGSKTFFRPCVVSNGEDKTRNRSDRETSRVPFESSSTA